MMLLHREDMKQVAARLLLKEKGLVNRFDLFPYHCYYGNILIFNYIIWNKDFAPLFKRL